MFYKISLALLTLWQGINITRSAAKHYLKSGNKNYRFLVKQAKAFYQFTRNYDSALEEDKYNFFQSSNWIIDVNSYYKSTIPSRSSMKSCSTLVQGGQYGKSGKLISKGIFDDYLDYALTQTTSFLER